MTPSGLVPRVGMAGTLEAKPSRQEEGDGEKRLPGGISVGIFHPVHGSSQEEAIRPVALFSICALEN